MDSALTPSRKAVDDAAMLRVSLRTAIRGYEAMERAFPQPVIYLVTTPRASTVTSRPARRRRSRASRGDPSRRADDDPHALTLAEAAA